jgi:hypothetical protein
MQAEEIIQRINNEIRNSLSRQRITVRENIIRLKGYRALQVPNYLLVDLICVCLLVRP